MLFFVIIEDSFFFVVLLGWILLFIFWEGVKVWILDFNIGEVCGEVKKLGGVLGIILKFWLGKELYSFCESKLSFMGFWVSLV